MKRVGITLGSLIGALILAAVFARAWFVGQIPRLERDANEAWGKAGIPVTELPGRFPETEKNDDARWLEAMAGKLEIPVFLEPSCHFAVSIAESGTESDPLSTCYKKRGEAAKFRLSEAFRGYVEGEIQQPAASTVPPPAEIAEYLARHREELDLLVLGLPSRTPVWFDKPLASSDDPDYVMLIVLHRVIAADAFFRLSVDPVWDPAPWVQAIHTLAAALARRGNTVNVTLALVLERTRLALERKRAVRTRISPLAVGEDYRLRFVIALEWEDWTISRPESVKTLMKGPAEGRFKSRWLKFLNGPELWFDRPWADASLHDMRRVKAADALALRVSRACTPEATRRVEARLSRSGERPRDPDMARWNLLGPIIYAIAHTNPGSESRNIRVELEQELTQRVNVAEAARGADGRIPRSIPGFGASRCGPDRWKLIQTPEGGAIIEFADPPKLEPMKGAQIPLRYELPGPAKR